MATGPAFFWGDNGEKLSPEAVERQRRIAAGLRAQQAPTGPWSLIGSLAGEGVANWKEGEADKAESAGRKLVTEALAAQDYMGVLGNEWAKPQHMAVAQAMLDRELQLADRADQRTYEQNIYQRDRSDALSDWERGQGTPAAQAALEDALLQNEMSRLKLEQMVNPVADAPEPFTLSPGQSRFAGDGTQIATIPASADDGLTDTQRNLAWRAAQAGLMEGTPEYAEFMRSGGQGGGMALTVGPDGTVQFSQGGAGGKAPTEGQSKDTVYATRASGALPVIDHLEQSLLSYGEFAAGMMPMGLGNYLQSEDYQVAQNAGREFLASVLRKDTGAAVTPSEEQLYGNIFLPRPGDRPATVERKRNARALALEAIKAGMPQQALDNMLNALMAAGGSADGAAALGASPAQGPAMTSPMGPQSQPQAVSSQQQYDALPAGAPYLAPDGTIRTKGQ